MKTSAIDMYNIFKVTAIALLLFIIGLFQNQYAFGAGSPKVSAPSPQERREKANVHFDKGESYRKQGNFKAASRSFEKAKKELSILKTLDSKEADRLAKFIADTRAGMKVDSKW